MKLSKSLGFAVLAFLVSALPGAANARDPDGWTQAYQAPPAYYDFSRSPVPALREIGNPPSETGTVRFSFRISTGGTRLKIRLSNEAGQEAMQIDDATVALADDATGEPVGPLRQIRFGGQTSITLPAGAPALSDAVDLPTKAFSTLVVSVYTPSGVKLVRMGGARLLLASGDQASKPAMPGAAERVGRPIVSGVSVSGLGSLPVVVAFGDSITDGLRKTAKEPQGYPEQLARRFAALPAGRRRSVVNAGIGGNRLLVSGWGDSALARLDRDVLRLANVTHVILLEGINDIGNGGNDSFGPSPVATSDALIGGYRQFIARCRERGIKVVGATILPFKGAAYYSPEKDAVRTAVNEWIRKSGEFDGVIDFAATVADPEDALKLAKPFDSGDHLHPNSAGYAAMGNAVDMGLFR